MVFAKPDTYLEFSPHAVPILSSQVHSGPQCFFMLIVVFSKNPQILNWSFLVQTLCPGSVSTVLKLNHKAGLPLNLFTGAGTK